MVSFNRIADKPLYEQSRDRFSSKMGTENDAYYLVSPSGNIRSCKNWRPNSSKPVRLDGTGREIPGNKEKGHEYLQ